MKAKQYRPSDFRGFMESKGIFPLTGEACGVGMRVLCDVTPQGEAFLADALGGVTLQASAWNGRDGAKRSVMLFREMFRPLVHYGLLKEADAVVEVFDFDDTVYDGSTLTAYYEIDDETWEAEVERLSRLYSRNIRVTARFGDSSSGMRNKHQFSGRTV